MSTNNVKIKGRPESHPVFNLLAPIGLGYLAVRTTYMYYPNDPSRSDGDRHYLYMSSNPGGGIWKDPTTLDTIMGAMTGTLNADGTGGSLSYTPEIVAPGTSDRFSIVWNSGGNVVVCPFSIGFNRALTAGEKTILSQQSFWNTLFAGTSIDSSDCTALTSGYEFQDMCFKLKVKTDNAGSANDTFVLPKYSGYTYAYTVDWGAGTREYVTVDTDQTHDYNQTGTFVVKIYGTFQFVYFNDSGDKEKVLASQIGDVGWSNFNSSFFGCSNMLYVVGHSNCSTIGGLEGDFAAAWQNCTGLTSFPAIDTSNATRLYGTWAGCDSLTSFPEINTSSVWDFSYSWFDCAGLTSFPPLDTSSGTLFGATWSFCSSLDNFPEIDTSSGTDFTETWRGCSGLVSFPMIDTSSGTIFSGTWYECTSLTSFPAINTSFVTDFNGAWGGCSSLTSFPLIDTSSGTNFSSTWASCSSLTSFPLVDTSSGTNFTLTWSSCSSLTSFPLIDTSSGTNFSSTWGYCYGLSNFPTLNLRGMTDGTLCFAADVLSTSSYSALLIDMALGATTGVSFDGGGSKYDGSATASRNTLTATRSWTITDGGLET